MKKITSLLLLISFISLGLFSCNDKEDDKEDDKEPDKIDVSTTSIDFGAEADSRTVTVTSNISWSISNSSGGWCQVSPSYGNGSRPLNIMVDENTSTSSRSTVITIGNELTAAYLNIYQAGAREGGDNTTLPAPTGVTAVVDGSSIKVSWSPISGATGYKVYRGSTSDVTFLSNVSENSYTDNSPLDGLNYYKVSALNNNGESDLSSFGYCKYEDQTIPATPTGVKVIYQNFYLVVSWNAVPNAARYAVWYKRPLSFGESGWDFMWVDASKTTQSFQWSTMYLGTYSFYVVASSSNYVNSNPSATVTYNINK